MSGSEGLPRSGPPVGLGPLVGRQRERTLLARLLGDARLVTLTGTGGSGKTRLAMQVVNDVGGRFEDGVAWAELAGASGPGGVVTTAAGVLGVPQRPGRSLTQGLERQLGDRRVLLVVDNCEHVVAACATLVSRLLATCPNLHVMATGRTPLTIAGETTVRVTPLDLPDVAARTPQEVGSSAAVQLFVLRAQQADFDFALDASTAPVVAKVCRRLDGLPLALELAAARVRSLGVTEIAAGLDDRFRFLAEGPRDVDPRQRGLRASVAWSEQLLEPTVQRALARLGVFAGSFSLDAARAVAAEGRSRADQVVDAVIDLVDHSLLVKSDGQDGQARYRLLETVRAYARERLAEHDDPDLVYERHLDHYLEVAREAEAGLAGPSPETRLDRLAADLDDLRVAMDHALAVGRPLAVLEIAHPTLPFWMARGLYVEMRHRLTDAVASPDINAAERARGLTSASVMAAMGGDFPAGHDFATRAVILARRHDDDATVAQALVLRSWCGFYGGAVSGGSVRADLDTALAITEELGDTEAHARALTYAGAVLQRLDPIPEGRARLEQAIAAVEARGPAHLLVTAYAFLSGMTVFAGELDRAYGEAELVLQLAREHGQEAFTVVAQIVFGLIAVVRDDEQRAWAHLDEAARIARGRGLPTFDMMVRRIVALASLRFAPLPDARKAAEGALEVAREAGSRWDESAGEWLLGLVALEEGERSVARAHLERAGRLSREPSYPLWHGRALLGLAGVAGGDGDTEASWDHAHEALATFSDHGDRLGGVDALEAVAGAATGLGRPELTVRLLAAAERFRGEAGIARPRPQQRSCERWVVDAHEHLDADQIASCREEGRAMSFEEAVAYARRGRGQRDRPRIGWGSLTPTEQEVAELVSGGCTNSDIGAQLLVSVNTVKTHLSRIYAKTGITGRAELAAEGARRVQDGDASGGVTRSGDDRRAPERHPWQRTGGLHG